MAVGIAQDRGSKFPARSISVGLNLYIEGSSSSAAASSVATNGCERPQSSTRRCGGKRVGRRKSWLSWKTLKPGGI
jgi:hypothetical protein